MENDPSILDAFAQRGEAKLGEPLVLLPHLAHPLLVLLPRVFVVFPQLGGLFLVGEACRQTYSTVPRCARAELYNAEINQRHQEGCHGEPVDSTSSPQVAPEAGIGEVPEEEEVGFIIDP
ncbi:hypothetical protein [Nodosilinea sp. P-1105]|uniref:hypothetical protein n=1 Tax=Nodosilinea sp. P-1105 TaxID=2546229 RepID=UPI00146ADC00|nr:hypothetical protein [Nodosilinea sp. P-1105]NMF86828.1 hypothetical protein [Nodosilinea sp. P-1105]